MIIFVLGLVEPLKEKIDNRMNLLNEAFILIFQYQLMCFTGFVADMTAQS